MNTCEGEELKALEAVVNTVDKKERKLETNRSLYLKTMGVRRKDTRYKPEACTQPSQGAGDYFTDIQKRYPTMIITGEEETFRWKKIETGR